MEAHPVQGSRIAWEFVPAVMEALYCLLRGCAITKHLRGLGRKTEARRARGQEEHELAREGYLICVECAYMYIPRCERGGVTVGQGKRSARSGERPEISD